MLIFVLHAQAWAFPVLDSDHSTKHKSIVLRLVPESPNR